MNEMQVPIFKFLSGEFTGLIHTLDPNIYNVPLRRDIIKNVYEYWRMKDRYVLKKTKSLGEVAGSGKKPAPQKGRGAARQGNKRAPQRAGGGVCHGVVPRYMGFPINSKLRLLAIKTMLSARLYEDRLIFIDSEAIEFPKTQMLKAIVEPFGMDKLCLLAPNNIDANFEKAARNISNLKVVKSQEVNLPDLLLSDYIILTKKGLKELEATLEAREKNYFRNRKVSNASHIEQWKIKNQNPYLRDIVEPIVHGKHLNDFDDSLPVTLVTPTLKQYLADLRKIQVDALEAKSKEYNEGKRLESQERKEAAETLRKTTEAEALVKAASPEQTIDKSFTVESAEHKN